MDSSNLDPELLWLTAFAVGLTLGALLTWWLLYRQMNRRRRDALKRDRQLRSQIYELESNLADRQITLKESEHELSERNSALAESKQALADLREKTATREKSLAELRLSLEAAKKQAVDGERDFLTQKSTLATQLASVTEQRDAAQSELEQQGQRFEAQIAEQQIRIEALEPLQDELERARVELESRASHMAKLESDLSTQSSDLESRLNECMEELKDLRERGAKLEGLEVALNDRSQRLKEAVEKARTLEAKLGTMRDERDVATRELEDMRARLDRVADVERSAGRAAAEQRARALSFESKAAESVELRSEIERLLTKVDSMESVFLARQRQREQRIRELEAVVASEVEAGVSTKPPPVAASDDLKRIRGIGRVIEGLLHEMGVTSFAQIAGWTKADLEIIRPKLGSFGGRVERDDWIEQARKLSRS